MSDCRYYVDENTACWNEAAGCKGLLYHFANVFCLAQAPALRMVSIDAPPPFFAAEEEAVLTE